MLSFVALVLICVVVYLKILRMKLEKGSEAEDGGDDVLPATNSASIRYPASESLKVGDRFCIL